jgi:hypothetical protein
MSSDVAAARLQFERDGAEHRRAAVDRGGLRGVEGA